MTHRQNPALSPRALERIMAPEYPVRIKNIKPFTKGVMNQSVRAETDKGTLVIRLPKARSPFDRRLTHTMLQTLSTMGFPCPNPVTSANAAFLAYPVLAGKLARVGDVSITRQAGRLLGIIHTTFAGKQPLGHRPSWDPEGIKTLIPQWRARFVRAGYPNARETLAWIENELTSCDLPTTLPRGWTHQDLKPENTLVTGKMISGILDFDNAYEGALIHDVTTSLMWWCVSRNRLDQRLVRAFLGGYETQRTLTPEERQVLLKDALRFRLLRELFIGPMTTLDQPLFAHTRARKFLRLYRALFGASKTSSKARHKTG